MLDVGRARVVLVEATDELLGAFHPSLRRRALTVLRRRGVEVRLGVAIDRVEDERVHLAGGEVVPAATLVWAAGVRASPLGAALGRAARPGRPGAGRTPTCGSPAPGGGRDRRPRRRPDDGGGTAAPARAGGHAAGRHVAESIAAAVAGPTATRGPFHYRDKGIMATIGRAEAVAELPFGLRFGGFPGWLAWLGLHLSC